ncbi:MAG: isocitrate dehydrogenase (NADP(+)) [Candidatus Hydrothermae bacterium]|nr:isocitrate dehydrogenase (NADP(+)) [Candidatus Hydrothermae bacterium]
MAEKIRVEDGKLVVPDHVVLPYIEGDGIGVDITPAMIRVVNAAVEKAYGGARSIEWMEVLAGEKAYQKTGSWLPEETLNTLREYVVSIKGPLTTPVGGGIRSLNVTIRQRLDLYSCVRPVRWLGSPSPLKDPASVNLVIFRENTEDVYAGVEWPSGSEEARKLVEFLYRELGVSEQVVVPDAGIGIKPISPERTKRHVRKALRWAFEHGYNRVTLMHKGNIMKFTEGAFRTWGYEVAKEEEFAGRVITEDELWETYNGEIPEGKVLLNDRIADNMFQQLLTRTSEYQIIVTPNLNGDYISDEGAALVGGLGMAPGANIGDGVAVFEATHGTAPKYAGKDKVNPGSLILSAAMMLEYMGWKEAAARIYDGIRSTLAEHKGTYDLVRGWKKEGVEDAVELSTSAFAEEIIRHM